MLINGVERYMVGLRCPVKGCPFDQLTPATRLRLPDHPDPEREAMRSHLNTHGVADLADMILDTQPWRTTYRLVKELKEKEEERRDYKSG